MVNSGQNIFNVVCERPLSSAHFAQHHHQFKIAFFLHFLTMISSDKLLTDKIQDHLSLKHRSATHNAHWLNQELTTRKLCIFIVKVHIFWEGHKISRNLHLLLFYVVPVKNKAEISKNFVAFSEYMNFTIWIEIYSISSMYLFFLLNLCL